MTLTDDQQRLKALLTETVTLLCKNGLQFQSEVSIDGVIGITVDKSNVFLVCIREHVQLEGASSSKKLSGGAVKQSSQSEDVLSAPSTAASDTVSSVVGTQPHDSYAHHSSPAANTKPCRTADCKAYNAVTQNEVSCFSSIAADNQNADLSMYVSSVDGSMNTTGEIDSHSAAVADSTPNPMPDSLRKKSTQDTDAETMVVKSHKDVVNIKFKANKQEPESLQSHPQSDLSADDSDASDLQDNTGNVEMESETVPDSFANQQLPFRRSSFSAGTDDSNNQVRLLNSGIICCALYLFGIKQLSLSYLQFPLCPI